PCACPCVLWLPFPESRTRARVRWGRNGRSSTLMWQRLATLLTDSASRPSRSRSPCTPVHRVRPPKCPPPASDSSIGVLRAAARRRGIPGGSDAPSEGKPTGALEPRSDRRTSSCGTRHHCEVRTAGHAGHDLPVGTPGERVGRADRGKRGGHAAKRQRPAYPE